MNVRPPKSANVAQKIKMAIKKDIPPQELLYEYLRKQANPVVKKILPLWLSALRPALEVLKTDSGRRWVKRHYDAFIDYLITLSKIK